MHHIKLISTQRAILVAQLPWEMAAYLLPKILNARSLTEADLVTVNDLLG